MVSNERDKGVTGGGTGFLIKKTIKWAPLKKHWYRDDKKGLEWCWIRVHTQNGWIYLASIYSPPTVHD